MHRSPRATTFSEVMAGPARLRGATEQRPLRLELDAAVPGLLKVWADTEAALSGRVSLPGIADDPRATGTLQIAPLRRRRLRYQLAFRAHDGRMLRIDGWKSVRLLHPLRSMTTLPATLYDEDGSVLGEAALAFDLRALPRFLGTFRYRRQPPADSPWASRWRGQRGRLEVWYATLTDRATGTGAWLHHEIVAPEDGAPPYLHGWVAVFPRDEAPLVARLRRHDVSPGADPFAAAGLVCKPDSLKGDDGEASWSLAADAGAAPLWTFPRWAWERELLPAAQVVATPGSAFTGTVRIGGREFSFRDAPGAASRIYGHGNARRWAWLHADLGDGDVLEVVTAVSTRPLLRRLRPLGFVRLRLGSRDWPANAGPASAWRMRSTIALPQWSLAGRLGDRRLRVDVRLPAEQTITLDYAEPHGDRVVCRNSERADATVLLERRSAGRWNTERQWRLAGNAHAEVGGRE